MELTINSVNHPEQLAYLRTQATKLKPREIRRLSSELSRLSTDMMRTLGDRGVGLAVNQVWNDELQKLFGFMPSIILFQNKASHHFPWDASFNRRVVLSAHYEELSLLDNEKIPPLLFPEGCLSIPGHPEKPFRIPLVRPSAIKWWGYTLRGRRVEEVVVSRAADIAQVAKVYKGRIVVNFLKCRVLQHEIDHTNGVLTTDRNDNTGSYIQPDDWENVRDEWKELHYT